MEETDAQSAATAVAGELDHHRPHRSAIDNRCFRRPACSTRSNLPGSRACHVIAYHAEGCICDVPRGKGKGLFLSGSMIILTKHPASAPRANSRWFDEKSK